MPLPKSAAGWPPGEARQHGEKCGPRGPQATAGNGCGERETDSPNPHGIVAAGQSRVMVGSCTVKPTSGQGVRHPDKRREGTQERKRTYPIDEPIKTVAGWCHVTLTDDEGSASERGGRNSNREGQEGADPPGSTDSDVGGPMGGGNRFPRAQRTGESPGIALGAGEGYFPTRISEKGSDRTGDRPDAYRSVRYRTVTPSAAKARDSHERYAFRAINGGWKATGGPENPPNGVETSYLWRGEPQRGPCRVQGITPRNPG